MSDAEAFSYFSNRLESQRRRAEEALQAADTFRSHANDVTLTYSNGIALSFATEHERKAERILRECSAIEAALAKFQQPELHEGAI